jgi:hypothetical protein
MNAVKQAGMIVALVIVLIMQTASAAPAASLWDKPAEDLAEQIASILGPGQAHLTIRNLSTISVDEIPAIRRLLEQDLKAHGVPAGGTESANSIRVTLSENLRERLWVAEVTEGSETHVAMVHVDPGTPQAPQASGGLMLRKQTVFTSKATVLALLEVASALIVVEPEEIVLYGKTSDGWREQRRVGIGQKRALARDPRGIIFPSSSGDGFEISIPGMACNGSNGPAQPIESWPIHCHESDDPWRITFVPVTQTENATATDMDVSVAPIKAFYSAGRNYFTGVITANLGVDLPPFYAAALYSRPSGTGLLVNAIDGKVLILDGAALKPVSGTRDWGSDFAVLQTRCGAGTQIIASGSGEAASDSLRAYELPALEAIPASAPLTMDGTVTAMWTAPDGKSLFAAVRTTTGNYEVDRVTALCN